MDFFDKYNEASWEFTYADPENLERNQLQVGLVAMFYIDQCYLPHKRAGLAQALTLYYHYFGKQLKWCAFDRKPHKPDEATLERCCSYIKDPAKNVDFIWSAESPAWMHVGSYSISGLSRVGWHEQVHQRLSYFRFYLPVEALQGEGKALFQQLIEECCRLLQPLHGLAGLGMQVCYEYEEFQDLEFEIAQEFSAIDIGSPSTSEKLREGFRSVNWYTILDEQWVDKLGGLSRLKQELADPQIALLPYPGGTIIRAGDWPELGWIRRPPPPELYIKVNQVLKPVRVPVVKSFHYGSVGDEIRFNKESSNQWLRRFDREEDAEESPSAPEQPGLKAQSGAPCPRPGVWYCDAYPDSGEQTFMFGVILPEIDGQAVTWRMIKAL